MRRSGIPKGYQQNNGTIKHATTYQAEIFRHVCNEAQKQNKSFNQVVGELLKKAIKEKE